MPSQPPADLRTRHPLAGVPSVLAGLGGVALGIGAGMVWVAILLPAILAAGLVAAVMLPDSLGENGMQQAVGEGCVGLMAGFLVAWPLGWGARRLPGAWRSLTCGLALGLVLGAGRVALLVVNAQGAPSTLVAGLIALLAGAAIGGLAGVLQPRRHPRVPFHEVLPP